MEDKEALEASAVVRKPTDLDHRWVDKLFPDGIVAACICAPARTSIRKDHRLKQKDKEKRTVVRNASSFPVIMLSGCTHWTSLDRETVCGGQSSRKSSVYMKWYLKTHPLAVPSTYIIPKSSS